MPTMRYGSTRLLHPRQMFSIILSLVPVFAALVSAGPLSPRTSYKLIPKTPIHANHGISANGTWALQPPALFDLIPQSSDTTTKYSISSPAGPCAVLGNNEKIYCGQAFTIPEIRNKFTIVYEVFGGTTNMYLAVDDQPTWSSPHYPTDNNSVEVLNADVYETQYVIQVIEANGT